MKKSQSMMDFKTQRGPEHAMAAFSPPMKPFDKEELAKEQEFIKAVRAGKAKKVFDMLNKDFAHSATKGHGEAPVAGVLKTGGSYEHLANCTDKQGESPLAIAARAGHVDIGIRLLAHGADASRPGPHGITPVMLAAQRRDTLELLRAMFRTQQDPDLSDAAGMTAMHHAAEKGNVDVLLFLVNEGAALNPENLQGNTPLHLATKNQKSKAVTALLSKGADPSRENRAGIVPTALAKKQKVKTAYHSFGF